MRRVSSGNKDIAAFLDLCQEMGLPVIARIGPYNCAERDSGGLPIWLRFIPGMVIRDADPVYLGHVDAYYKAVLERIAPRQFHKGGPVLSLQLENEHNRGWGSDAEELRKDPLFGRLENQARARGIEVPLFFSQQNHGGDPVARGSGNKPWSTKTRQSPWYTTEFWAGWYNKYGELDGSSLAFTTQALWKMAAYGAAGFGVYVFHGGSNFGYTGDEKAGASYDYAAAAGEAGDLRPLFFRFKQAACFARSFESILADADLADGEFRDFASGAGVAVHARKGPADAAVFVHYPMPDPKSKRTGAPAAVTFQDGTQATLEPGEVRAYAADHPLAGGIVLTRAFAQVLWIERAAGEILVFTRGREREKAALDFAGPGLSVVSAPPAIQCGPVEGGIRLEWTVAGAPAESVLQAGNTRVRVLALHDALADLTWRVETGHKPRFLIGTGMPLPPDGGRLVTEERTDAASAPRWTVAAGEPLAALPAPRMPAGLVPAPRVGDWVHASAAGPAAPEHDDKAWLASEDPMPMGADGGVSAHAWYRAKVTPPSPGTWILRFPAVRDTAQLFLDGKPAGRVHHGTRSGAGSWDAPVELGAGAHTVAVFTSHLGRPKVLSYIGGFDGLDRKGLFAPVELVNPRAPAPAQAKIEWCWRLGAGEPPDSADVSAPDFDDSSWTRGDIPEKADAVRLTDELADLVRKNKKWDWAVQRALLPALDGAGHLRFAGARGRAVFHLNGTEIGRHMGGSISFTLALGTAWRPDGPNILTVVSRTDFREDAGVRGAAFLVAGAPPLRVTGWRLRGGTETELPGAAWARTAGPDGAPVFHKATFEWTPPPDQTPVLRLAWKGLSRGFAWLNGVNLGRFPDVIPAPGLYLPEPFLKPGANEIILLDEEGHAPDETAIEIEAKASRLLAEQPL